MPPAMFISDEDRERKRRNQQMQRELLEGQLAANSAERKKETTRARAEMRSERKALGLDADDATDILDARARRARRGNAPDGAAPRRRRRDAENEAPRRRERDKGPSVLRVSASSPFAEDDGSDDGGPEPAPPPRERRARAPRRRRDDGERRRHCDDDGDDERPAAPRIATYDDDDNGGPALPRLALGRRGRDDGERHRRRDDDSDDERPAPPRVATYDDDDDGAAIPGLGRGRNADDETPPRRPRRGAKPRRPRRDDDDKRRPRRRGRDDLSSLAQASFSDARDDLFDERPRRRRRRDDAAPRHRRPRRQDPDASEDDGTPPAPRVATYAADTPPETARWSDAGSERTAATPTPRRSTKKATSNGVYPYFGGGGDGAASGGKGARASHNKSMWALAELQGDTLDQREARRAKEADFRRLLDEQRRRDQRRREKEAAEAKKLDERDAAEMLAKQRTHHAETVKRSRARPAPPRVTFPADKGAKPITPRSPVDDAAPPPDERDAGATFHGRSLPRTRGGPKVATPPDDLEDSGGLEAGPAIPGLSCGAARARSRREPAAAPAADLEGMYREMLREQRLLRERVEELARSGREDARARRRDRRDREVSEPESARPSTYGSVAAPAPRRASRRAGTAPDDHESEYAGARARRASDRRRPAPPSPREPTATKWGGKTGTAKDPWEVRKKKPKGNSFFHEKTVPRKPRPRALKPPPLPSDARQTDAPRRIRLRRAPPPPPPARDDDGRQSPAAPPSGARYSRSPSSQMPFASPSPPRW